MLKYDNLIGKQPIKMIPESPQKTNSFKLFLEALNKQKVLVLGHLRPDGDCIGSQVALVRVLRSIGIEAYLGQVDDIPKILAPFMGDTPLIDCRESVPDGSYALVSVDAADKKRLGPLFEEAEIFGLFDHHRSTRPYAKFNFIDPLAAASAEVLAGLFLQHSCPIDPLSAQALYVGLLTDTGQFRHSSTTPKTLRLAATLLEKGAQVEPINHQLFEQESLARLSLRQLFLSSLRLELEGQLCIGLLNETFFSQTKTKAEDAEGFADYTRMIEGVKIGAVLECQATQIKGSLRSRKENLRVDLLAAQFGGGGHACAAGFRVDGSLKEFYPEFLKAVHTHLRTLATTHA